MMQDRRFLRIKPSGAVSKAAKIITDLKSPIIECSVVDYAAGGACLDISGAVPSGKKFELLHAGTKKKCRVVWTFGSRVGVSF